jgi:hypothetical protein
VYVKDFVEIETASDAGAASLLLDQDDVDEPFLHYQGTSAASVANNVSTWKGGGTIEGYVKVEVAGDGDYWMPYTSAPSQTMPYREITATTNTTANDYIILCTAASADYDVELINVASVNGQVLVIKNKAASTYDVGVDPNGSQNIDNNSTSATLNPGDSITIMSNGTEWSIH